VCVCVCVCVLCIRFLSISMNCYSSTLLLTSSEFPTHLYRDPNTPSCLNVKNDHCCQFDCVLIYWNNSLRLFGVVFMVIMIGRIASFTARKKYLIFPIVCKRDYIDSYTTVPFWSF